MKWKRNAVQESERERVGEEEEIIILYEHLCVYLI